MLDAPLGDVPIDDVTRQVREQYESHFQLAGGHFYDADWRRVAYVLGRLRPGGAVLDVGAGAGHFVNILALAGGHASVVALDRVRNDYWLRLSPAVTEHRGSIDALPYTDGSFDVVVCMEVLEHLEADVFDQGLSELRRVCRGQLVMTVPYCEPEPLYPTHVRRFEDEDLLALFPRASFTLLSGPKKPWVLMEERLDGTAPSPPDEVDLLWARLRRLEHQLERQRGEAARLREALDRTRRRRVVRWADAVGRLSRRVRGR